MPLLTLDVRLDGYADPIGILVRDAANAVAFSYTRTHLARADACALSLSLPLREEPFDDRSARAFFDNLLQERDAPLRAVMARENLARDDIAGLLLHLGKDCPGALSVLAHGAPPAKVPGDLTTDYTKSL
jgi:serine/threonine-protein kinase HipA